MATLSEQIAAAVSPVLADLFAQFGVQARLRRAGDAEDAPDGSPRTDLLPVPGVPDPFDILPTRRPLAVVQKDWGRSEAIVLEALVRDAIPLKRLDVLKVLTGPEKNTYVQVLELRPEPTGGMVTIIAKSAGNLDKQDKGF